jgi:hypothetical protein
VERTPRIRRNLNDVVNGLFEPRGVPRLITAVRTGHPKVLASPAPVRVGGRRSAERYPLGAWPPAGRLPPVERARRIRMTEVKTKKCLSCLSEAPRSAAVDKISQDN